jgi:hypothetical protein
MSTFQTASYRSEQLKQEKNINAGYISSSPPLSTDPLNSKHHVTRKDWSLKEERRIKRMGKTIAVLCLEKLPLANNKN